MTLDLGAAKPAVGRPRAKQARARQTRSRLLRSGEELLRGRSFDDTGIADIAARAGCSTGAFYHHFADKAAFYLAIVAARTGAVDSRFEQVFAPARADRLDAAGVIGRFIDFATEMVDEHAGLIRASLEKSMHDPKAWDPLRAFGQSLEDRVLALLRARGGAFAEAEGQLAFRRAMQFVYGTLMNAILNRPGPLAIDDPAMARELTRMALGYLLIDQGSDR
ncbi:MAG: TetR/AcrR family transcriptional regulator [Alphaproteobacteria bacterium]|jgi:AcrR family transcriptional regulator|nr:TetR/AcrR family transcriptional regulator [Alphaproteobacteria bacterium]MDP6563680.1 TetR/AcrR family transcriptional regulator [Alphaproteobacteria bacterium]MDP6814909.1 TetR/AcrR family transcriptional regulator [Alphaproteobacteria bacterium]